MDHFLVCTELELRWANTFELNGVLSPSVREVATCWRSDVAASLSTAMEGHQDGLHLCRHQVPTLGLMAGQGISQSVGSGRVVGFS